MAAEAPKELPKLQLRLTLSSGPASIPLHRIHRLVGYATLAGQPDDAFLGWLTYHSQPVPIFDLNLALCGKPTPANFGTRILLLLDPKQDHEKLVGFLVPNATDTTADATNPIDLDAILPMLYPLLPPDVPAHEAAA